MNPRVQVYLFTHNRPEYIKEVAASILNQDYDNFELVITDNSDDARTGEIVRQITHPRLKYIKRKPCSAEEHFNMVSLEVDGDYFVWFHDDDVMMPSYLSRVMSFEEKNPEIKAIGTNCFFIYGGNYSTDIAIKDKEDRIFDNSGDFIKNYLAHRPVPPFPSYTYETRFMKENIFPLRSRAGHYSDASLFMAIIHKHGRVAWLMEPLIYYRLHKGQFTHSTTINSRLKLLRYVYKKTNITRHSEAAMLYRRAGWCSWLKYSWKGALKKHPKRYFKVLRIMLPYLLQNKKQQLLNLLRKRK